MQKGQRIVIRHLVLPILDELVIIHRTFDGEIEEIHVSLGVQFPQQIVYHYLFLKRLFFIL